jgi:DNA-binding NtrC family response regulator
MLAMLGADGHEVVAMGSGIDLLDTLAVSLHPEFGSGYFDLVIAEARMLGAENARVFSGFRNRTKIPPFVFTTVHGDQELQAKTKQFGALAVLDKPLDMDELRQIVNRFLHHLTEDRAACRTLHSPHSRQPPSPPRDLDGRRSQRFWEANESSRNKVSRPAPWPPGPSNGSCRTPPR